MTGPVSTACPTRAARANRGSGMPCLWFISSTACPPRAARALGACNSHPPPLHLTFDMRLGGFTAALRALRGLHVPELRFIVGALFLVRPQQS